MIWIHIVPDDTHLFMASFRLKEEEEEGKEKEEKEVGKEDEDEEEEEGSSSSERVPDGAKAGETVHSAVKNHWENSAALLHRPVFLSHC